MPRAVFAALLAVVLAACGTKDLTDAPDGGHDPGDDEAPAAHVPCEPAHASDCEGFGNERPPRLSEHTGVYDQDRAEFVIFGGTSSVPTACSFGGPVAFERDTWIYADHCDGFLRVEGDAPSPSGRHAAAWGDGSVWVFGGRHRPADVGAGPYTLYDDLFRFDVAKRRWQGVDVTGDVPAARVNTALAWDSQRNRLWLFGGNTSADGAFYAPEQDLWSFDPRSRTWERHATERPPAARLFHAMLYDAARDRLVVFGGADAGAFGSDARYFSDLWALDLSSLTWERLDGGGDGPEGRFWASLVHDTASDVYVLFGGHDDQVLGNRNDTWLFDPDARTFERVVDGDRFRNPATGLCEFPPDFTDLDTGAPERRSAHTMVWSDACRHGLLFGGKTDCGAIDDVWRLDDGRRWRPRLGATEGESCLRWREDPDTCGDLCF